MLPHEQKNVHCARTCTVYLQGLVHALFGFLELELFPMPHICVL